MQHEFKVEDGKLKVSVSHGVDGDADGKPAASVALSLELDGPEILDEMLKDGGLLDLAKKKLGIG